MAAQAVYQEYRGEGQAGKGRSAVRVGGESAAGEMCAGRESVGGESVENPAVEGGAVFVTAGSARPRTVAAGTSGTVATLGTEKRAEQQG